MKRVADAVKKTVMIFMIAAMTATVVRAGEPDSVVSLPEEVAAGTPAGQDENRNGFGYLPEYNYSDYDPSMYSARTETLGKDPAGCLPWYEIEVPEEWEYGEDYFLIFGFSILWDDEDHAAWSFFDGRNHEVSNHLAAEMDLTQSFSFLNAEEKERFFSYRAGTFDVNGLTAFPNFGMMFGSRIVALTLWEEDAGGDMPEIVTAYMSNAKGAWIVLALPGDEDESVIDNVLCSLRAVYDENGSDAGGNAEETEAPGESPVSADIFGEEKVYTDAETVQRVQQALNAAGYDCGTPDGIAGKKTYAAIQAYCDAKGLETNGTDITDSLLKSLGIA